MAKILDGKKVTNHLKEQLRLKIEKLPRQLSLVIFHDNNLASLSYLKGRKKLAESLNINIIEEIIDKTTTEEQLLAKIRQYNKDDKIDGIMVDRPLPKTINEQNVLSTINSLKDVDGYTNENLGKLLANQTCFYSCTPLASIKILEYYNIDLTAKNVVIIGRSINVGKPLALMLLNKNATVTICHSKSKDIYKTTKKADIIFLAVGKAGFLTREGVSRKSIVLDIGINFTSEGKLCGDMASTCQDYIKAYSPVPGGVGVVTNVLLMENLYQSFINRNEKYGN